MVKKNSVKVLIVLLLGFCTVFIINGKVEKENEAVTSKVKKKVIPLGRYENVTSEEEDKNNLSKLVSLLN
ncbi:hypothetical protein AAEX28_02650 [Lentisphaerota bacterium WC36G]|nr:hypothetical protein LJT99_05530 [Lentisphaerae bacterium WC36]